MSRRPRVLAVDDEELVLKTYARCLRHHADVVVARSGADTVAALRADPYDVLMLDQRLGDEVGTTVARAVRDGWPELRIILVTGDVSAPEVRTALDDGVLDLTLMKPFEIGQLRALVLGAAA